MKTGNVSKSLAPLAGCLMLFGSGALLAQGAPASKPATEPAAKPKAKPGSKPAAKPEAKPEPPPKLPPPRAVEMKIEYPEWLFPIDPGSIHPPKEPPKLDDVEQLSIPESDQKFTLARINDPFNAPDWHPNDHGPMPDIVSQGRKPHAIACGYCHTPTGAGRPENAPLAGLPEAYIKEQLEAWRSGDRQPIGPDAWKPARAMQLAAVAMKETDIDEAAKYFSQLKLKRRQYVIETVNMPRAEPSDWVYEEVGGNEDLESRLIEVAQDITRHQRRDDRLQYTAYVPPGSLFRGKTLATTGDKGKTVVCATCHQANLKGTDKIPPIAGRSPTYLLRQLIAFKNGTRAGEAAAQMTPTVAKLELDDMVALAAYVGSLYP